MKQVLKLLYCVVPGTPYCCLRRLCRVSCTGMHESIVTSWCGIKDSLSLVCTPSVLQIVCKCILYVSRFPRFYSVIQYLLHTKKRFAKPGEIEKSRNKTLRASQETDERCWVMYTLHAPNAHLDLNPSDDSVNQHGHSMISSTRWHRGNVLGAESRG